MKVLILKGLPASGKSTFAKKLIRGDIKEMGRNWKRVNKDDLRAMLDDSYWSRPNEDFVLQMRDDIILNALLAGYNVVVDDTNLAPKHQADIQRIVPDGTDIEVKFFDIEVEEAIKRDLKRPVSVGKDVIMKMYDQYLKPEPEQPAIYTPPQGKPDCYMVDIDGTLAHMTTRAGRPFDWHRVGEDEVDPELPSVLNRLTTSSLMDDEHIHVVLLSGRDEICRPETEKWLLDNSIRYDVLYMRPKGDSRKDFIVKQELFDKYVRDNYRVRIVFDDRDQVVDLWRSLGLKCYQVAEGKF